MTATVSATRRARRRDAGERAGEAVVLLLSPPRNRPEAPETAPRRGRRDTRALLAGRAGGRVEQAAAENGHGRTPFGVDDGRHRACDDGRFKAEREGRATRREGLRETRLLVFSVRIAAREREPRHDDGGARARSRDGGRARRVARSSRDRSNRDVTRSRDGGDEARARRRAVVEDAPRRDRRRRERARRRVEAQLEPNEVARPGEDVAPPRVVRQTHLVRLERSATRHDVFCLRHVASLRVRGGSGRTDQREPLFERDGAGGAVHRDALRARRGARRGAPARAPSIRRPSTATDPKRHVICVPNASRYAPDAAGKTPSSATAPPNSAGTNAGDRRRATAAPAATADASASSRASAATAATRVGESGIPRRPKRAVSSDDASERRASSERASSERASRALASSTTRTVVPAPVPKKLPLASGSGPYTRTPRRGADAGETHLISSASIARPATGPIVPKRHDALAPTETRDRETDWKKTLTSAPPSAGSVRGATRVAAAPPRGETAAVPAVDHPRAGEPASTCAASAPAHAGAGGARTRSARRTRRRPVPRTRVSPKKPFFLLLPPPPPPPRRRSGTGKTRA